MTYKQQLNEFAQDVAFYKVTGKTKQEMNTKELLSFKLELNNKAMAASQALTNYCQPFKTVMGLVTDECKDSEQYKALQQAYLSAHNNLRAFNQATNKNKELQKAIRENIMERRMSKVAQ